MISRQRQALAVTALAAGIVLALGFQANYRDTPLPSGSTATHIVVEKAARRMTLFRGDVVLAQYTIALGREPEGAKQREGDGRTPEGAYTIDYYKLDSQFHRALHISYPSPTERSAAAARGTEPGGLIMIHGLPNGFGWLGRMHLMRDWTDGCIAVTNHEIEAILGAVAVGTPITIKP
jgi:murein L,D-transpeptidase YafK